MAVARASREIRRAERVMRGWAVDGVAESDLEIQDEIARIERAIQVLEEFGGLQAAMKRSVALTRQIRRRGRTRVDPPGQQVADDSNHGRKPRKFNRDCTICHSLPVDRI